MSKHYELNELIWKCGVYLIWHTARPSRSYVGSTRDTFKSRWARHLTNLRCNRHGNPKLQQTVNSLGVEGIRMVVLQECKPEWAYSIEQYWINTIDPWYNIIMSVNDFCYKTVKNRKKPVIQYDRNGYFLREYPSISFAAKNMKSKKSLISNPCYNGGIHKECYWRFKNGKDYPLKVRIKRSKKPKGKYVLQYTKKGNFLKEFSSLGSAARSVKGTAKGVRSSCKGKFSHRGFVWRYKEGEDFPKQILIQKKEVERSHTGTSVCQYSLEGNFIKKFNSFTEVIEKLGVLNLTSHNCASDSHPLKGYFWRLFESVSKDGEIKETIELPKSFLDKKIIVYKVNGDLYKVLNSRMETESELDVSHTSIINNKGDKLVSRSHGYILFRYFEGYPDRIRPYRQNNQKFVKVTSLETDEERRYVKMWDCVNNENISSATFQTYYKRNSVFTFKGHRFEVESGDYKPFD